MTYIVMAFVMMSAALFQVMLPSYAWLGQAKPPLLLAAVLYYALTRETPTMLVAAFVAGLLQDVLSPMMPLGYSVLVFCVAGWGAGWSRRLVLAESLLTSATFGAGASVAVTVVLYVMLVKQGLVVCPVRRAVLKAVACGCLGALFAPLVFAFALRLDRVVGNVEVRGSIDGLE